MTDVRRSEAESALIAVIAQREVEAPRVSAQLAQLRAANRDGRIVEIWYADILDHFAGELTFGFGRLMSLPLAPFAQGWQSLPTVAFAARFLIELQVWVYYCTASRDNARRFYEDKFRDGHEFNAALQRLLRLVPGDHDAIIRLIGEQEAALDNLASSVGANVAEDPAYTRVAKAAEAVGLQELFASMNKMLSKFAHPSAMLVLNYLTPEYHYSLDDIVRLFRMLGVSMELDAWKTLGRFIDGLRAISPAGSWPTV